ncbi:MAG: hypothetical protein GF383_11485 [Candidatus Lokiarchaeota archaeon]|nr:hypothetical protein [Candidatus Lokiarchaeota archaeon]MBD3341346.1 hypothetical protein [Candidatus Lokiarchaeota archaeon]
MRLIVDTKILFAALIKDGATAELMISDKIELFAHESIFVEFAKHEKVILDKTHRTKEKFKTFLELLKEQITIVSKKKNLPFMDKQKIFLQILKI